MNSNQEINELSISYSTFWHIWQIYLPDIKFLTPRSDLCQICKEFRFNKRGWTLEEKEQKIAKWYNHTVWAKKEREYYRYCLFFLFYFN